MEQKKANHLLNETSPYLLQHAYNPVEWYPWGDEAWDKAKNENKLVLISIGYSSCHWCHVMERESFENDSTADFMNENFVCIKVDREERPDIDQIYMAAVQLMTGSGGWPLNCFALPDGRPIYGGTYFPNANWNQVLRQLHALYRDHPEKAGQYAEELTKGIQQMNLISANITPVNFNMDTLIKMVEKWKLSFDKTEGGPNRAPKFPLPNNYEFLLHYAFETGDHPVLEHVELTLEKMAFGGIYDQIGGGFARYSVDGLWKVPHFEKMLYDNAQLMSLYSGAYQYFKNPLYKNIVSETFEFIRREMTSSEGFFFSALDADSEGEEGKYYVWQKEELENLPGLKSFEIFKEYYNVNSTGYWEEGNYILLRKKSDKEIASQFSISEIELENLIAQSKKILLAERNKRTKPGLDDKILTSWNFLMVKALCDAYCAFAEEKYLDAAINNAKKLLSKVRKSDGGLYRVYKNNKATVNAYLEDYSFCIEALIALYECSFDPYWLEEAGKLTEYVYENFFDSETGKFWFTSKLDPPLITRTKEIQDNVIPSSNSSLARALFRLGIHLENKKYTASAENMLHTIIPQMTSYGPSYSNWGILYLNMVKTFREIVIIGPESEGMRKQIQSSYLPNALFAGGKNDSRLPLLQERFVPGKTLIYVCENRTCKLPVENTEAAMNLLK